MPTSTQCPDCSTGQIWLCGCFNDTSQTAGADVLARLYALESNGQLNGTTANSIITNIVAYGYTTATLTCQQSFVSQQSQSVNCNNGAIGALVQANPNCTACKTAALALYQDRLLLEQQAVAKNPGYTAQTLDPGILSSYFGLSGDTTPGQEAIGWDGACMYVCEQCVTQNITQDLQMQITAECDFTTDEFSTAFVSGMTLQAQSALSQNVAALQSTGLDIQNNEGVTALAINIATTLQQMTQIAQVNGLKQSALNMQSMTIDPSSTSVVVQNVQQSISVSMLASLISRAYTDNSIQNSIDYQSKAQYIQLETTFTSLIDSLQATVSTMQGLLTNIIGQIMVSVVVLLFVIAMIFGALFFFRPQFLFGASLEGWTAAAKT